MTFTVILIGRPNVGKSTIFNRLAGKKMAMTADVPGVTRDVREAPAMIVGVAATVIDTAGLDQGTPDSLPQRQQVLTRKALLRSDAVIFVMDAREGLTAADREWARWLRKLEKPVVLVANKCDGAKLPAGFDEAYALGFGDPLPLSAEHHEGFGDLYAALLRFVPEKRAARNSEEDDEKPLSLAIVGRPNAGKSTLVNGLLGEERVLTGPEAGLTRDAVHVKFRHKGKLIRLVDTAGLRKKSKVQESLENQSVAATQRVIRLAQVVVLVVDALLGVEKQDLTIAAQVAAEGRVLIVVLNKWDAVKEQSKTFNRLRERIERSLHQYAGLPVLTVSAETGKGISAILPVAIGMLERWQARVGTGALNRWLEAMIEGNPPPMVSGRRLKIRYITQVKSRPPSFVLWTNKPGELPDHYMRYLTNGLRKAFELDGVPLRFSIRKGDNPYQKE